MTAAAGNAVIAAANGEGGGVATGDPDSLLTDPPRPPPTCPSVGQRVRIGRKSRVLWEAGTMHRKVVGRLGPELVRKSRESDLVPDPSVG